MVPAVILAAGDSRRMGVPKALLKLPDGSTFLDAIVKNLTASGFNPILLVLGKDAPLIRHHVPEEVNHVLLNEHPEQGQLSSLQLAINNLPSNVMGCLMALIDHPLISMETFVAMAAQIEKNPGRIAVPSKNFKKGHPTYFPAKFFYEILNTSLENGARQVLKNHPQEINYVLVDDDGIFIDFDTPEAYKTHFQTDHLEACLKPDEEYASR